MFGRKINFFEKLLLPVGIGITFFGFYLLVLADRTNTSIGWSRLSTLFLWMVLLFLIIVTAATEDMKEELGQIQREHVTEIKLMREFVHDQLDEIKLLRKDLTKKK
ncbi:hypothetical protein JXC34_01820 [Candidatus Woesearchaeota archaeon]|nr:hypothetical protein [Candidatus Woesearchaeota archaeon]